MSTTEQRYQIAIGTTTDGEKVAIEFRLTPKDGSGRMTVDHKRAGAYVEFGMTGEIVHERYGGECYGQCWENIRNATYVKEAVPAEVRNRLLALWERWHLNDLKAGCVHQSDVRHDRDDWRAGAAFQTRMCPERYAYGSAWLVEVIPDHVIAELRDLGQTYGRAIPARVGY